MPPIFKKNLSLLFKAAIVLISGLALICACTPSRFPVIHSKPKITREDIARERASEYFIKARDYERRGLLQMAMHFYEMAYELDQKSEILRGALAEKYFTLGQFAQALVLLKGDRRIEELSVDERKVVATLYLKMGQLARAAETLESIGNLSGEEYLSLGYIHETAGQLSKAAENYRKYFSTPSGHTFAVGFKIADVLVRMGKYDSAESLYVSLAQEFDEGKADVFAGLGKMKLTQADTVRAVDFLRASALIDSTQQDALRMLAQIAIKQDDYQNAIHYYQKLYSGNDSMKKIYGKTLALLYYYGNEHVKAGELLKDLLSENIDDYELHFYMGLVFSAQDNFESAVIELEKTLALKKDFPDAWQHICYAKIMAKDYESALEYALRFSKALPESSAAWRAVGYTYSSMKKYGDAASALQKAVHLDSANAATWFDLGSAFERDSQFENAAHAFRTSLRLNPEEHSAANYLGYMWAELGVNLDSAKVLLEFALKHDSANGAYLDSYAWIFYKMKDYKNALRFIEKALAAIDKDPVIYSHYGDILEKSNDPNGAIKAYLRSIELESEDKALLEEKIRILRDRPGTPVPPGKDNK